MATAAKKNKVRDQAICSWRQHFADVETNDIKKMKSLEAENAKLKKLLAERGLEIDSMDAVVRREWRACPLVANR